MAYERGEFRGLEHPPPSPSLGFHFLGVLRLGDTSRDRIVRFLDSERRPRMPRGNRRPRLFPCLFPAARDSSARISTSRMGGTGDCARIIDEQSHRWLVSFCREMKEIEFRRNATVIPFEEYSGSTLYMLRITLKRWSFLVGLHTISP